MTNEEKSKELAETAYATLCDVCKLLEEPDLSAGQKVGLALSPVKGCLDYLRQGLARLAVADVLAKEGAE